MTNGVNATDLNTVVDRLKAGNVRRDANNLALAGQIQFSSILRTLVDAPDQALEVVAQATQAREADKARPEAPERDTRPARRIERERPQPRETERSRPSESKTERAATGGLKPVTQAEEPKAEKPVFEIAAPTTDAPQQIVEAARTRQTGTEAPIQDPAAALTMARGTEITPATATADAAAKAQANLTHAAQEIASGALSDRNFSRVGEDLHDATMQHLAQTGSRGGQTAASSLKQQQETDLASRIGLNTPLAIQVDTQDAQAKLRATPTHTLSGGAVLADLEGFDGDLGSFAQTFGRSGGESIGTEQRTPSHGMLMNDRAMAATNATDSAFNQMMRAQGSLLAAQQAGQGTIDAKPVISSEVSQVNGVGAATGPSQVSQTAKANPTTAARQPERPQPHTPAEQISVKIRQAVDEGLDKINIKLNPGNLGRVEVRLDIKDGHINATVLAERPETLDLLQKDARGLERALLDAGLRTDVSSLSFGLRGDGQKQQADFGRERRQGAFERNADRFGGSNRDDGMFAAASNQNRSLRSNGGVDIRV